MKQGFVYIMSNRVNGTLYVGVTSNLLKRIFEHKQKAIDCFTRRYACTNLVYYEAFEDISMAITREKQIKAGSRSRKLALIAKINPKWLDLYEQIIT